MPAPLKNAVKQACLFARDLLSPLVHLREVSILCYHSVGSSDHVTAVRPEALEAHLSFLKGLGVVFVSLEDIAQWQMGARPLPERAVALTFDDGYADFETNVLPILKKYNAPAAVFVMGEPDAAQYRVDTEPFMDPQALMRVSQEPLVEVGYHTRTHPNLDTMPMQEIDREVTPPFNAKFFAYPGGHYSIDAMEAVARAGYKAAYSIKPTLVTKKSDTYGMPRNVVLKTTRQWELRFMTTKAVQWYRSMRRVF